MIDLPVRWESLFFMKGDNVRQKSGAQRLQRQNDIIYASFALTKLSYIYIIFTRYFFCAITARRLEHCQRVDRPLDSALQMPSRQLLATYAVRSAASWYRLPSDV